MKNNILKKRICPICKTTEGKLHDLYCTLERCPFCGGQLFSCSCQYKKLGFNHDYDLPCSGLPKDIYENGLPKKLEKKWQKILNKKGRVPYIYYIYPNICARCGKLRPEMFRVSDGEWSHYIEPKMRREEVCLKCYIEIKQLIGE